MKSQTKTIAPPPTAPERLPRIFSLGFGLFFGLALVKFGNPVLAEVWNGPATGWLGQANAAQSSDTGLIGWPTNGYEWALDPWPMVIGYVLLAAFIGWGIFIAKWKIKSPWWLVFMPLLWLAWQGVSATQTLDMRLTSVTLKHFVACVACFYLGAFCLHHDSNLKRFWLGILAGFAWVLASGLFQHFGGLEDASKHFWLYIYPDLPHPPPELLKRMNSTRIFSTLFYPNALAGSLLLCLPALLCFVWQLKRQFTLGARRFLVALVGVPALGCLFWSGSKGGWLLLLLLGLTALLRMKFERKWKIAIVAVVLICGLAGFAIRFAGYFKKGATSVTARFDYWRAAAQTAVANPIFGTGPGTFAIPYRQIKKPEAEMARLTHNDYLQQASDSGLLGGVTYALTVWGILVVSAKRAFRDGGQLFAVWLGVLGWALQSFMEFGLYIPALAWLAFALLGLLVTTGNEFDKPKSVAYSSHE